MQANGCPQHNGETGESSSQITNGACSSDAVNGDSGRSGGQKDMNQTDQDIVRLIGQHLKEMGLE
jgi:hypothetical protein